MRNCQTALSESTADFEDEFVERLQFMEILEARGEIPENLRNRIMSEKDSSVLKVNVSVHSYQAVSAEISLFVQRNPDILNF